MAITTLDGYIASSKQNINITKTASRTALALTPFSVFDQVGSPGAGVLAGTSTSAGVVPTDLTAGCPLINFTTGTGYLTKLDFRWTVAGTFNVYDILFKAGAYTYAAGAPQVTLSSQPDIFDKCPDYSGGGDTAWGIENQIWIEVSTAFVTGTAWQVQVAYINQSGGAGTTVISASQNAAALIVGKMFQLALASGDSGVQKIVSVTVVNGGTAMTAGAFNVLILRPLATNLRVPVVGGGEKLDLLSTGMPIVYPTSALVVIPTPDGTATGLFNVSLEIANG